MDEVRQALLMGHNHLRLVMNSEGSVIRGQDLLTEANRMLADFFTRHLPQVPRDDPDRRAVQDLASQCRVLGDLGFPPRGGSSS